MPPARLATALILIAPMAAAAERPLSYVALLANGRRIESDRLTNWHAGNAVPQLGGTSLLDPANPFRWLIHRGRRLADEPEAFIELSNGDRLPGVVVDYRGGTEDRYHPLPPHFVVRVSLGFEPPDNKPVPEIRVATQCVRRIVWQRRSSAPGQPGTALYRDGRSLAFRSVRLKSGEIHVLLTNDDRQIDWDDLAELHLPAVDPWSAWFDQVAAVCPSSDLRLLQAETSTGLVVTASLATMTARFEGNSADPNRWVHGLQPAWSLDILWIPFRDIVAYRSFAAHELPLSHISARQVVYRGALGGAHMLEVDRSMVGSALRSEELEFGWGLGVGGGTELTFELPAGVRSLRASVCLDRSVGSGGCIRPRIFAGDTKEKPLWEGPILIGSQKVADTGLISLSARSSKPQTIVLQIDAILSGQPAGADPLDIRDHADWCDPLLEFDPAVVRAEIEKRLSQRFIAWRGWNIGFDGGTAASAGLEVSLHASGGIPGTFEPAIRVQHLPLVLWREMTIGPHDNWLVVAATRLSPRLPESKIEVRIDGEVVGQFAVPGGRSDLSDVRPLAIPLSAYQKREPRSVRIEIRQAPSKEGPAVQYWAILVARHVPTLVPLLDDDAMPSAADELQTGSATFETSDRYSGVRSLKLTSAAQFRIDLPDIVPVRAAPQWGEARFIRLAVRKKGGGRASIELETDRRRDQPARYDLGQGPPSHGKAIRIWEDPLPDGWIVITRDAFADFGDLNVKSLVVSCPDGESVLIDQVYLARGRADFDLLPPPQAAAAAQRQ